MEAYQCVTISGLLPGSLDSSPAFHHLKVIIILSGFLSYWSITGRSTVNPKIESWSTSHYLTVTSVSFTVTSVSFTLQ